MPRDEPYGPSTACQCISTYRYTIHLCIYPSIHIYLSIHLSIYLSIHLSIYLSTYPSTVAIASSSAASAACSWSVHTARTLVGARHGSVWWGGAQGARRISHLCGSRRGAWSTQARGCSRWLQCRRNALTKDRVSVHEGRVLRWVGVRC